jgi:solute carrier family 13 (sodium-dependent dicarboxylate transporter), member 2/3/5
MKIVFIILGISFFFLMGVFDPPERLDINSWLVARLLILMTFWWFTNCVPMSVTALLPLIIIPFFSEINISSVARPYANPIIFLLLGGFILGLGFQKSLLHKRLAMFILSRIGSKKKNILFGFILSTSFLSMWLSNTATCLLMLPIVLSVLDKINMNDDIFFRKVLILSIAYSSSIGGMGTLIGTAPNAIFAGFMLENHGIEISFVNWMLFSLPLVIILTSIFWFFCLFLIKEDNLEMSNNALFLKEYKKIGRINSKEKVTLLIISTTILLWVFKPFINSLFELSMSDSGIAIFGAVLFFVIPFKNQNFLLDKEWFKSIPWNILILFGGGLSLASLITSTGLAAWISGSLLIFGELNIFFLILILALIISFMTEITSNTATTLLFLPIIVSFAITKDYNIILMSLPIVLTASCAFMMPIATPPNAIVFSTNEIEIPFMVSMGIIMNLSAVLISSVWIYYCSHLLKI